MLINKKHLNLYEVEPLILVENRLYSLLNKMEENSIEWISVFLSHKHNEDNILKQVVALLNRTGVKTYLDWQDDEMPADTCGETAEKIKKRIIENDKFILLATDLAIESKWCNWELGFADSKKYPKNIAIMPIAENDGSWKGNEYLQIYPTIKTDTELFKGDYYVEFNDNKTKLADWLKS